MPTSLRAAFTAVCWIAMASIFYLAAVQNVYAAAEIAKLLPLTGADGDQHGNSVAINGDYMVVGVPGDDEKGTDSGAVYVYRKFVNHWVQDRKLTASDGAAGDQFGISVAIRGTILAVGSFNDANGDESGAVYIFSEAANSWTQRTKLTASDGAAFDSFGQSVALGGGVNDHTLLVGANRDDDNGAESGSVYVFKESAINWTQEAKLTAGDGAANDNFGQSVAVEGDTAIIGANLDDEGGVASGSVYVFTRSGGIWTEQTKVRPSDAASGDQFGHSVSLNSGSIVIGAYLDTHSGVSSGSAYVFVGSGATWSQQAKLIAGDAANADRFGHSVFISGDSVIAGATHDDDNGNESGSAYVFKRSGTTWSEQAKLKPGDGAAGDLFGSAVALDGDTAVLGTPADDDAGTDSGSAFIFNRIGTGWSQLAKFHAGEGESLDLFGISVDVSGDTAVVGSYFDDDNGSASGSVYVYLRSGGQWNLQAKVRPADGATGDRFGYSVAIDGDTLAVGAYQDGDNGLASGSAYVFTRSGGIWTQQAKLTPSDGASLDFFGWSIDISGDTVVVGAKDDDDNGSDSGSAYVFFRSLTSWSQQAKIVAGDGAAGDQFGVSVSIYSDTIAVGAPEEDDGVMTDNGAAYVFTRSGTTWSQQAKIVSADIATEDEFGTSVSLSGDSLAVGSLLDDDNGNASGSAYVFTRSGITWSQQAKLTANDAADDDRFGKAISLNNNTIAVTAVQDDDNGFNSGSGYVFTRSGSAWTQDSKFNPRDGGLGDLFGDSVAVSGDYVVAGVVQEDPFGNNSGAAYAFNTGGANTLTAITSDTPDPSNIGQNYTVAVTVSDLDATPNTPSGVVAISDGTGNACNAALTSGSGSCVISGTPAGKQTLSATYPGDANFLGSSDTEDHTVVPQQTLTIEGLGNGFGTVTINPGSIICNLATPCDNQFPQGTVLTLTAMPTTISEFVSWTGCDSAAGSVCTQTLDSNETVQVTFALGNRTLTVDGLGTGTGTVTSSPGVIACTATAGVDSGTCSQSFEVNTDVNLTASPAAGSVLSGWSGCASVSGNICTVQMAGNRDVQPTFAALPPTTTTITSDTPDPSNVGQNYTVAVTVADPTSTPNTPTGTVAISDGNGNNCNATLTNGSGSCDISGTPPGTHTLTATYPGDENFVGSSDTENHTVRPQRTLTVDGLGSGSGTVTSVPGSLNCSTNAGAESGNCSAELPDETVVTLTATPASTSTFAGWTGCDSAAGSVCTQTLQGNETVQPTFTALQPTTTTMSISSGTSQLGNNITLTATVSGNQGGPVPSGTVTFKNGATDLGTSSLSGNMASLVFGGLAVGNHSLTANYGGDGLSLGSTSASLPHTVVESCTDALANAKVLNDNRGTITGSNSTATGESNEFDHASASVPLNSVWCQWTAPEAGTMELNTAGSDFDTTLAVYTGTAFASMTQVAANNDSGGVTTSRVSFNVSQAQTYRIVIDGAGAATGNYLLNWEFKPATPSLIFSSVLPTSRSGQCAGCDGAPLTPETLAASTVSAFATIAVSPSFTPASGATGCFLAMPPGFPALFSYQTTDATNQLIGSQNTPVDVPVGGIQSFIFTVTPLQTMNSTKFALIADCANSEPAAVIDGVNTLLLSAERDPTPDLIALGATPSNDGVVRIPGTTGSQAFAASAINIGASGTITATVDDNGGGLPLTMSICQTNPTTGVCINPAVPGPSATMTVNTNDTVTFAVFATASGAIAFDPGSNRIFLNLKTADGVTRGATSVAVVTE